MLDFFLMNFSNIDSENPEIKNKAKPSFGVAKIIVINANIIPAN